MASRSAKTRARANRRVKLALAKPSEPASSEPVNPKGDKYARGESGLLLLEEMQMTQMAVHSKWIGPEATERPFPVGLSENQLRELSDDQKDMPLTDRAALLLASEGMAHPNVEVKLKSVGLVATLRNSNLRAKEGKSLGSGNTFNTQINGATPQEIVQGLIRAGRRDRNDESIKYD